MKLVKTVATVLLFSAAMAGSASAALVSCGGPTGIRVTTIDPGLVGGLCYTQLGNLQNADISALGLTQLDKDVAPLGQNLGLLHYTLDAGNVSGTWGVGASAWSSWDHLFLGFHFGNAGDVSASNPDSFIVELARADLSGTWALGPGNASLNGLSDIFLLAQGACTANCGGGGTGADVPEPATLALVGLGLFGVFGLRRRTA